MSLQIKIAGFKDEKGKDINPSIIGDFVVRPRKRIIEVYLTNRWFCDTEPNLMGIYCKHLDLTRLFEIPEEEIFGGGIYEVNILDELVIRSREFETPYLGSVPLYFGAVPKSFADGMSQQLAKYLQNNGLNVKKTKVFSPHSIRNKEAWENIGYL